MTRQTVRFICPHCDGTGYQKVYTADGRVFPIICGHCKGKGTTAATLTLSVPSE